MGTDLTFRLLTRYITFIVHFISSARKRDRRRVAGTTETWREYQIHSNGKRISTDKQSDTQNATWSVDRIRGGVAGNNYRIIFIRDTLIYGWRWIIRVQQSVHLLRQEMAINLIRLFYN